MICSDCAGNSLGKYILTHGSKGYCRCCNTEKQYVMDIEEVENWILQAWNYYYEDANEFGTSAYDVLTTYDIDDLFESELETLELEDANPKFIQILRNDFDEREWFPLGEGEIHGANEMFDNWENFCNIVKHKRRYFFLDYKSKDSLIMDSSPKKTLLTISDLIKNHKIVTQINPEETIYRGRRFKNNVELSKLKATDLGTPLPEYVKHPNRFSPEGIPMFYGAFDTETIKHEIDVKDEILVIGEFHSVKNIPVIDFTKLPDIPSLYDDKNSDISGISFLHEFSYAITQPLDSESKIEYVPTQVFIEYLKKTFGNEIQGIKYRSSKFPKGNCVVLFYNNSQCYDYKENIQNNGLVLYNKMTI